METSSSDGASMESEAPPSASNVEGPDGYLRSRTMRFIHSPILTLLEYSGVLRFRPDHSEPLIPEIVRNPGSGSTNSGGEVSIRIIDPDNNAAAAAGEGEGGNHGAGLGAEEPTVGGGDGVNENGRGGDNTNTNTNNNTTNNNSNNREGSSYQRYDIQGAARWIEQILPFSLLLLIVFIRQHLQGFVVTIYSTLVLFKTNDTIQKQTALKGERKLTVLVGYSIFLVLNITGIYSWKWGEDLCYPLLMIPPNAIPPFWHAVFIIVVNDIMARQTAMFLKLILLMYYKNGKGHNFRRQGQLLTLVEYTLLLYRALLPTPVWYRFFLNKEYGSLFSSLTTGLYLTFKLTSIIEKVQSFFYALKALTRKEIHYGSHATPEQINVAGDLCAICQEKMQTPIFLRCKHVFCEDCVSEWFERERTCPLCRSLVRAADLKSYADGSTSLYFQLF